MTEARDGSAAHEPVSIPDALAPEIRRAVERLMAFRLANRVAYGVTTEEQFVTGINEDIADQRTYLMSQIRHSDARVRAFQTGMGPLPELDGMTRAQLLEQLDLTTFQVETVFRNPANWGKRVNVPYSPPGLTGLTVLNDIANHEAHHEGQNRATLAHFGIPQPPEVTATFGK